MNPPENNPPAPQKEVKIQHSTVTHNPFSQIYYRALQDRGFAVVFGEQPDPKKSIPVIVNSREDLKKLHWIQIHFGNTPIGSLVETIGMSNTYSLEQAISGEFNKMNLNRLEIADPNDVKRAFMTAFNPEEEVTDIVEVQLPDKPRPVTHYSLKSEDEYIQREREERLFKRLKKEKVEPFVLEELTELTKQELKRILSEHPELTPESVIPVDSRF